MTGNQRYCSAKESRRLVKGDAGESLLALELPTETAMEVGLDGMSYRYEWGRV